MENISLYIIIISIILFSFFRNYKKEVKKNKERAANQQNKPLTSSSTLPPFSGKNNSLDTTISENISKEKIDTYSELLSDSGINYDFGKDEGQTVFSSQQNNKTKKNQRQEEVIEEAKAFDLQLDTQEDIKRAFVHSLIFKRKY